jgi:glycosyltransferase involved in cell wall biosynthesis
VDCAVGLEAEIPDVSVVICTRDSPHFLERVLKSLAEQTLDRACYEIIVVDNGSSRIEELARREGADVVVREHEPGHNRARNAGWKSASAPLVGFLDDDALAAPDWLHEAGRVYEKYGRRPTALGGPILQLWEVPRPEWFRAEWEARTWGEVERLLRPGESFSGSNFFCTRSALERLAGFNPRLGMIGGRVGVGDETDLFRRLWLERPQPEIVYSPTIVVRHPVAPHKLTVRYQLRRAVASGESEILRRDLSSAQRLRTVIRSGTTLLKLSAIAALKPRRPLRQWAVEEFNFPAVHAGRIWASIRRN